MNNPFDSLHDGIILEIRSCGNDSFQIVVESGYLDAKHNSPAQVTVINLTGCEWVEFKPYDRDCVILDFQEIASFELQILQASEDDSAITIACDLGVLRFQSCNLLISLSEL